MTQTPPHPAPVESMTMQRRAALQRIAIAGSALSLSGCSGGGDASPTVAVAVAPDPNASTTLSPPPASTPVPAPAAPSPAPAAALRVTTLSSAFTRPWGMAVLPDGRMLVTQRGGSMVLTSADGKSLSAPLSGVPPVVAVGQGGLLDVVLDPDFASDPWVYWCYSEAGSGGTVGTAVARGRLAANGLIDGVVIFRQLPKVAGGGHFGSRLVFRADKTLWVTLGERQLGAPSQDVSGHLGKVVRIARDGTVPSDNPGFGANARPELWSIGHRNPQGAAVHPTSGELWLVEHGPQGGDELNRAAPGSNHGWPARSYGCNYGDSGGDACRLGGGVHAPTYVEPATYWAPSISPSGMMFHGGDRLPAWRGNVLCGALSGQSLWRVALDGTRVVEREDVAVVKVLGERIRCVVPAPDGWILMLSDSGKLMRLHA